MNDKFVSIIIPTLDRSEVLINTLRDLLSQNYNDFEIIVVDQSVDINPKVINLAKKHKDKIFYLHIKEKGTSNAKNVGAKHAKGGILIFLDDDLEIKEKDFIRLHLDNYADEKIGGVGGRVLMESDISVNQIKEVGKFKYFGLKEITNFNANFRSEIDHVYGCNQSFRKDVFKKVGGFSKIFIGNAHLEEADLSFRVKKSGHKIIFDPKAVVHHLYAPSGGTRIKNIYEMRYWLVHNGAVFYLRNYNHFLFPLYFLKQFVWTTLSSIKRSDFKMFQTMVVGLVNGYNYYWKQGKN